MDCFGRKNVPKGSEYCEIMYDGDLEAKIACYDELNIKTLLLCEEKKISDKTSDPDTYVDNFKTCLADLGHSNYNQQLCDELYPDDDTQLDDRYQCYKEFELGIEKDREYCEKKSPTSADEKYKCIQELKESGIDIMLGADYCYFKYYWGDEYE